MQREILNDLTTWLVNKHRMPLVLRGARQVGKTWIIRELAATNRIPLIEINLERNPEYADQFKEKSPERVLINIERLTGKRIDKQNSLLFIDEIQKSPWILANLRWFYEEMPQLPIIVTGSLLDFSLAEPNFSMPVGRISYLFMEPLSFKEFLMAHKESILIEVLEKYKISEELPGPIHMKLMDLFKTYLVTGGMPAVVNEWIDTRSPIAIAQLQQNLLQTLSDDFNKYAGRLPVTKLRQVLYTIPRLLGQKFKYSNVDKIEKSRPLKQSLNLLCQARVCHKVISTAARGVPLAAQINDKHFKTILLDTGLAAAILGLVLETKQAIAELLMINKGGIAEQAVGQMLRTNLPKFIDPALYYFVRDIKGSEAEIDYVIQLNTEIIPIEVKSGATGRLKSLHQFMADRQLSKAIRINTEPPTLSKIEMQTTIGMQTKYNLISIPFYLCGEINRLLTDI